MSRKKNTSTNADTTTLAKNMFVVSFQDNILSSELVKKIQLPSVSYNKMLGGVVNQKDITLTMMMSAYDDVMKVMQDKALFDIEVDLNDRVGTTHIKYTYASCRVDEIQPNILDYDDNGAIAIDIKITITGVSTRDIVKQD